MNEETLGISHSLANTICVGYVNPLKLVAQDVLLHFLDSSFSTKSGFDRHSTYLLHQSSFGILADDILRMAHCKVVLAFLSLSLTTTSSAVLGGKILICPAVSVVTDTGPFPFWITSQIGLLLCSYMVRLYEEFVWVGVYKISVLMVEVEFLKSSDSLEGPEKLMRSLQPKRWAKRYMKPTIRFFTLVSEAALLLDILGFKDHPLKHMEHRAAKTLSKVASLKSRSIDKGRRYKRRKESTGQRRTEVVSSLDFKEILFGAGKRLILLKTVPCCVKIQGQRAGKAPMLHERKLQRRQRNRYYRSDSLAEAIRLDFITKRKRRLKKTSLLRKMLDLVNQRKNFFVEERAKAKGTSTRAHKSQIKTYMMKYLKNQGSWKLNQLEVELLKTFKEEFDKLIKQIDSFAPISFEATKDSLKRFGEELQTKTPKRLKEDKDDEAKDDEPTKKLTKRRKQIARKGMHTSMDENVSDDSDKVMSKKRLNSST
ncbi:hypothetical protein Tco_0990329 [Tanacetum coccineum]|uniref:Uncharacterized protein n=1 Tax=Tanacetum coccineum TaxID=301880 RepID=A0ABQ5EXA5_9ASTR